MSDIYLLNDMKIEGIKNIPLLEIQFIPEELDVEKYDVLVFTSKNAAYSLDSFNNKWKNIPCYVIAPKTAKVIEELGGKIGFVGNSGHGNEFAAELMPHLKNKKVLYLKAKRVVSNLVGLLKDAKIDITDVVVYETIQKQRNHNEIPSKNSVIIFSSPSTVEYFFENFTWDESYKAVVIGHTTAKYLPEEIAYVVSKTTSIDDCIALAKEEASKER